MCIRDSSTTSPRNPLRTTSLKTTFRLLFNDSKWRRSRTPIRSRSRWGHRGDVRDALDGSLWTFPGTRNRPPAFSPRDIALLGGYSEPAPLNQSPVPPDANWCCTTGTISEKRGAILGARIRLRSTRRMAYSRYSTTVFPNGAHFWYKGDDGLWWLGKISARTTTKGVHLVRFLDDPGSIKLPLTPARYTTSTRAVRGSWCLHVHLASGFVRWIQRNVDQSRGAAVNS